MSKTKKFFGTDGIRGKVGQEPITPQTVMQLAWALGSVLSEKKELGNVIIGKDTRVSGYMLESAMEAGLSAAGMDVTLVGPMPTPAIAYLTKTSRTSAGVVISASHNPFYDNGIKFFSTDGTKLPDEMEFAIEEKMSQSMQMVAPEKMGKAKRMDDALGRYVEFCKSTIDDDINLKELKISLDCANGAAYAVAPKVYEELGSEIVLIGHQPDGFNINEGCGSTHLDLLQKHVLENQSDLGIAFDGDADRVLMVDKQGKCVDGDQLMFVLANAYQKNSDYKGGLVGTLMTNLGLEQACKQMNMPFIRANVGDRYVMQQLQKNNWLIGGESSGHIICLDKASTGDGLVSSLQVVQQMVKSEKGLSDLVSGMQMYPQKMINVKLPENASLKAADVCQHKDILSAVSEVELELADKGRVLLRPSGTEPVIRVMVEGHEEQQVNQLCQQISGAVGQLV